MDTQNVPLDKDMCFLFKCSQRTTTAKHAILCPLQCLLIRLMKKRDYGKSDVRQAFAHQYGLPFTKADHPLTAEPQTEFLMLFILEETNQ